MKSLKKLLVLLMLFQLRVSAQNISNVNLPKIVTPSPNAGALGKYGEIPVDQSTGIPGISVPVFSWTRERAKLSVDIGLSYHSGGHKVEEMSSDVGLGWSLNAGGVITRTVVGLPDEQYNGFRGNATIMPNLSTTNPGPVMPDYFVPANNMVSLSNHINYYNSYSNFTLLKSINDGQLDSQQDIYSFNYPGNSGRFVVGKDGSVLKMKFSNAKIEILQPGTWSEYFRITDEFGVQYLFDVKEIVSSTGMTLSSAMEGGATSMNFQPTTAPVTSWYMSRIVSADKIDTIYFNYSQGGTTKVQRGFYESVDVISSDPWNPNVGVGQPKGTFVRGSSVDEIQLVKLRSIFFPDQTKVNFNYSLPRVDYMNDSALTSIQIVNGSNSKQYNLSYSYFLADQSQSSTCAFVQPDITNDLFKRLRLDSVVLKDVSNKSGGKYWFEYNSVALPPRHSMNVDYWGFYRRGAVDNGTLIPQVKLPSSLYGVLNDTYLLGADRNSTDGHAMASVMTKIYYPTGGYTSFEFESNKAYNDNDWYDNAGRTEVTILPASFNSNVSVVFSNRVDVNVAFRFSLTETAARAPIDPNGPQGTCSYTDLEDMPVTIRIKSTDNVVNIPVTKSYRNFMVGFVSEQQLPFGKDYVVYFEWNTSSVCNNLVPFTIKSVTDFIKPKTDKVVGGIRIKRIVSNDNLGNTLTTQYSYNDVTNLSSGYPGLLPDNRYHETTTGMWNTCQSSGSELPIFLGFRHTLNRTSSPNTPLSFQKGSPIIYSRVEKKMINGAQNIGRTVSEFFPVQDGWTDIYPYAKDIYFYSAPGMLKKETVYSDASVVLQTTENEYTYNSTKLSVDNHRSLKVAVTSSCMCNTTANMAFLAQAYYPITDNLLLSRSTQKQFGDPLNPLTVVTDFEYDSQTNLLKKKKVVNSKGETLSTTFEYPNNYSGQAIYNDMVGRNMIAFPIIQKEFNSTTVLRTYNLNYDYFNGTKIYEKEIATSTYSNPSEVAATYSGYDTKGNVVQILTKDGIQHNYIWSDKGNVIAKTDNCAAGNAAYTSFEGDDAGGWLITGALVSDGMAHSGRKVYNLSSGNISRSGLSSSTTYVLTYWTKNTSALSISGTISGYPVLKLSTNGWTCYEHKVSGVTAVTVSGSGTIDDLRLYPDGALMTSYTYTPLIGITSQMDANNKVSIYEYDAFGRLTIIFDQDKKVLKRICYNYNGQAEDCSIGYSSVEKSGTFTRNNCTSGTGGAVMYTVPAGRYFSTTSQAEADAQAQADVNANGQTYANTYGICNVPCSFSPGSSVTTLVGGSISLTANTVSFYLVFYATTTLYPGTSYWVATINGSCRPTSSVTFTTSFLSRIWSVTINPDGKMYWTILSGAPYSPNSTNSTGTITYTIPN